ncbi:hypothetical protein Tco_0413767 [Tanacetum coccineum]
MTNVIKGEFEKIKDIKVEDVSLTYDTQLEVFNNEVNRLNRMNDDSEHEADDDMGYDPSDVAFIEWLGSKNFNYKTMDHYTMKALWIYWIRGDDEVELTDEESDDEDEIAEIQAYLQRIFWGLRPMKITKTTESMNGTRTYHGSMRSHGLTLDVRNGQHVDYEWYEAMKDSELKDKALRNKAIMEGLINEDDDESRPRERNIDEVGGMHIFWNSIVLYKVEDIATSLVEYVKFWDDWEVDRYGNANLVIMELLVKVSKRRAFWSLNEDILKITIRKTNTPYPSKKIRRIRACTHQRPQKDKDQYAVSKETQNVVFKI